jgi:L-lysine 2,3-aminomutase
MITKPDSSRQSTAWQRELASSQISPAALLEALSLPADHPQLAAVTARGFPLKVPLGYRQRMVKGDINDPLFRQVWPHADESAAHAGAHIDAVGDLAKTRGGGLIHKYQGRALLITTGACAIHCRYCFRRHFPYNEQLASRGQWRDALAVLAADPSIHEIILSGGDPLSLNDDKLTTLIDGLNAIPHLRRLRIHTRQPVVLPSRVDDALLAWLARTRLSTVIVVHVNHPQEIDTSVAQALARLQGSGATLLNQAVLLRGINDSLEVQRQLSESLFEHGVLPYYLHLLDPVVGAMHFDVPLEEALQLMQALSAQLPGYLVPRLAREIPGHPSKTVYAPEGPSCLD